MIGFVPDWPPPPGVRALVTERAGGVSDGPYYALNLGLHVGDAAADVAENRRRVTAAAGLAAEPVWLRQVHGTAVTELRGAAAAPAGPIVADAAWTAAPGVACTIMTADCLPVLLAARDGSRVGAAHAGWRGLAAGVLERSVAALGVPPADVVAWLGPAIGPAAYEVGADVRDAFAHAGYDTAASFAPNARGRWQCDLYSLARQSLARAGVGDIHGGGFCTYSEADRFFSYRREQPCGRFATLIWLEAH